MLLLLYVYYMQGHSGHALYVAQEKEKERPLDILRRMGGEMKGGLGEDPQFSGQVLPLRRMF